MFKKIYLKKQLGKKQFKLTNPVVDVKLPIIVYNVMRSKNEVLCAAAGRLAAERSEADKPAKAHTVHSLLF
jgi:hypothetical protein